MNGRGRPFSATHAELAETMNQLLEIQRLALQKKRHAHRRGAEVARGKRDAVSREPEALPGDQRGIARVNEQLRDSEEQRRGVERSLEEQRMAVRREFEQLQQRHNLRVCDGQTVGSDSASFWRPSGCSSNAGEHLRPDDLRSFGIAVLLKVGLVMHEYFPSRYFKYVLILACLAVVVRALASLLADDRHPRSDWLLKQTARPMKTFSARSVDYPIRRGPLKYLSWTRRSVRRVTVPADGRRRAPSNHTPARCAAPHPFERVPLVPLGPAFAAAGLHEVRRHENRLRGCRGLRCRIGGRDSDVQDA